MHDRPDFRADGNHTCGPGREQDMCSRAFGARHPLLGVTHNLENNLKVATAVGVLVAGVGVVVVLKVVEVVEVVVLIAAVVVVVAVLIVIIIVVVSGSYNEAVFCLQAKKPLHNGSYEHRVPKIQNQTFFCTRHVYLFICLFICVIQHRN